MVKLFLPNGELSVFAYEWKIAAKSLLPLPKNLLMKR